MGGRTSEAAKVRNNRDHNLVVVFAIMMVFTAFGVFLGWVMFADSGRGEPATMSIGKIYEVYALVRLDAINWKERSEGLIVMEEAQGAHPEFVEVPRREVEGEIVVGKGIMKLQIWFRPGDSSSKNAVFRYKTGDLADLRAELEKLKSK